MCSINLMNIKDKFHLFISTIIKNHGAHTHCLFWKGQKKHNGEFRFAKCARPDLFLKQNRSTRDLVKDVRSFC